MKEIIKVPFKYGVGVISAFIIILTGVAVFLAKNYLQHRDFMQSLRLQEIKGQIIMIRDQGRGSSSITIQREDKKFEMSLPIAWQVEEYGIQVGDSLYKGENNDEFIFYAAVKEQFRERCRVTIHP